MVEPKIPKITPAGTLEPNRAIIPNDCPINKEKEYETDLEESSL